MEERVIIVMEGDEGERIDKYLAGAEETLSRSFIQRLVKDGNVSVNQKQVKVNYLVAPGDVIVLCVPDLADPEALPEPIPLDVLYEDSDVIVVNKEKGMVVHPAAGHPSGTLVNALLYYCKDTLSGVNGVMRPGIVHRIDMDTTGVLIACKNDAAHLKLAEQLKVHSIQREYRAICYGEVKDDFGTVDAPIGRHPTDRKRMAVNEKNGRQAVTHYRVLARGKGCSYLSCTLETGRTHQIRVHMAHLGHPLLGDKVYGNGRELSSIKSRSLQGQTLHARLLGFVHPTSGDYMEFAAPLPAYFCELLEQLFSFPNGACFFV